ncbi:MAG: hypothetical protein ACWGOX_12680, partial [Desulforhopalus sp.]
MVAEKDGKQSKKTLKVKAKTGAWWKSTVDAEEIEEKSAPEAAKKTSVKPRRKTKKATPAPGTDNKQERSEGKKTAKTEQHVTETQQPGEVLLLEHSITKRSSGPAKRGDRKKKDKALTEQAEISSGDADKQETGAEHEKKQEKKKGSEQKKSSA